MKEYEWMKCSRCGHVAEYRRKYLYSRWPIRCENCGYTALIITEDPFLERLEKTIKKEFKEIIEGENDKARERMEKGWI